jgi:CheY-like chemotaxis protein
VRRESARILIVDDEPAICEILSRQLADEALASAWQNALPPSLSG